MKKLIALILILIITPFLIITKKTVNEKAQEISIENSKKPETANWEYVKERAFDENNVLIKGYDKPVLIQLNNSTLKDSLIVSDFIEMLKVLIPSIKIGFKLDKKMTPPFHYVRLGFGKDSSSLKKFFVKRKLPNHTTIYKSREGFITISDGSKTSYLNFDFNENIRDDYRKMYIEQELLTAVFSNKSMKLFNNQFPEEIFNRNEYELVYGFLGDADKFLLKKVYAKDFEIQFSDYLYENYPCRYAYSFLNKGKMKILAISIVTAIGILVVVLMFGFFQKRKFKYAYLNYLFPTLLIVFHFINLNWIYKYLTDFGVIIGWEHIKFGFVFGVLIAAITSLVLFLADKIGGNKNIDFTFQLLLKVLFTFITFNLPLLIAFNFFKENKDSFTDLGFIEFYFPWFLLSLFLSLGRGLLIYLNHFSDSLVKEKDVELSRLKEVNAQSELKLLQSHINPHFLYNALNSIAGLAHNNPDKTEKMALSLSNLFRYSINKKGQKMSTVKEEVLMVQNYLEIEKIRFGERLKFTLHVDDALENEQIPMYILQPLVENAIKHGVSEIRGEGHIALEIKKELEAIVIAVSDNGPDFPEGLVSGHGLQTIYDLLRLSYGDKASLKWQNTPKKQISISINK